VIFKRNFFCENWRGDNFSKNQTKRQGVSDERDCVVFDGFVFFVPGYGVRTYWEGYRELFDNSAKAGAVKADEVGSV